MAARHRLRATGPGDRISPLDGARYLEAHGVRRRLCCLAAHHSGARFEAEERGFAADLAAYELEQSPVADALIYADMHCGLAARMIPSREAPDVILGQREVLHQLGAVPRALVWDNESAVGCWRNGKPQLTHDFQVLRGLLGVKVILLRPRDPEAKGVVERVNQYLETSFLPGRSFTSPVERHGDRLISLLAKPGVV